MKNIIALFAALALTAASVGAQTNAAITNAAPAPAPDKTKYDLTLGAGGVALQKTGNNSTVSFSLSADPFQSARSLWLGASQGLAWKPFAGSTDVDAEWQIPIYKDTVYILPSWSAGTTYGSKATQVWRTGPELIAQYYVTDHSFIIGQANYDMNTRGNWSFKSTESATAGVG
jgi:hypothetical protein